MTSEAALRLGVYKIRHLVWFDLHRHDDGLALTLCDGETKTSYEVIVTEGKVARATKTQADHVGQGTPPGPAPVPRHRRRHTSCRAFPGGGMALSVHFIDPLEPPIRLSVLGGYKVRDGFFAPTYLLCRSSGARGIPQQGIGEIALATTIGPLPFRVAGRRWTIRFFQKRFCVHLPVQDWPRFFEMPGGAEFELDGLKAKGTKLSVAQLRRALKPKFLYVP